MKQGIKIVTVVKIIIVLLVINYMVITVIFNDNVFLKYLRDIILLIGLFVTTRLKKIAYSRDILPLIIVVLAVFISFFRTEDTTLAFTYARRYLFPILVLVFMYQIQDSWTEKIFTNFCKFLLVFFSAISVWGIFQAWVLGDKFLMKIGYNTGYLIAYGTNKLNHSFYFGGLGIQRVVSTVSNCNTLALILGVTLIFFIGCYKKLQIKWKNMYLILVVAAYILTFSRSNFLGMIVAVVFVLYPYIPHKKVIALTLLVFILSLVVLYFVQGSNGLVYKLVNWANNSLNFTESSAAGRMSRWTDGLNQMMSNPFGKGFGTVGSIARDAGVDFTAAENSYLAMAIDFGIIGMLAYVTFFIVIYRKFKRCSTKRDGVAIDNKGLAKSIQAIVVYLLVSMFFSNYIYGMEAISIIYIYIGVASAICFKNKYSLHNNNYMGA